MKRICLILFCCALWGCESNSERATINFQKGGKFFDKKEYDIAVYYYEMIPEDNPLYAQAQKKLAEIKKFHDAERDALKAETDVSNITVIGQSFSTDKSGRIPVHKITLRNESKHVLKSVTMEITYVDGTGRTVDVLTCSAETAVFSHSEDSFTEIRPGMVKRQFADCQIRVLKADFK